MMLKSLLFFAVLLPAAHAVEPGHHHHHAAPPAAEATRDSLYQLELALHDQAGQPMRLDAFRGRPAVVSMFFASCTQTCPLLISDIKRFEAALTPAERARLGVVLVSFDGERDGPAAFAALIARHGLDPARWRLATASPDDVRLLAASLGIRYTRQPDGGYVHSAVVTLLDEAGRVAGRTEGVIQPVEPLVTALRQPARP